MKNRSAKPRTTKAERQKDAARAARRVPGLWATSWAPGVGVVLLGVVLVLKILVLVRLHDHPLLQATGSLDPAYYVDLARQVASGHDAPVGQAFFVSPLYVYFLAIVFTLTGGSLVAVKIVQVLLGTAAVWLIWRTAFDWFGRRAAWAAAALASLCGLFTFYEVILLQAALDPFLTALDLYLVSRAWCRGRPRWFLAAGIALGLHALNRPNVLPYALLLVLLAWAVGRKGSAWIDRTALIRAAMFASGLLLVIAPITIRNYHACGEPVLISSHGGLNFYIGNNPRADGTYSRVAGITPSIIGQATDADRVAETAAGRRLGPSGVSRYFSGKAWEWIRTNPDAAIALLGRKIAYVFNSGFLTLNYSYPYYSHDESLVLRLLLVGPWLLIPLGVVGLFAPRPNGGSGSSTGAYVVWALFIPVYALAVAVFFVSSRYRMPLLVPLSVTAGAAIDWVVAAASRREYGRLLKPAVALAVVAVAVNWNLGLDSGLSSERTKMISHFVEAGEDDAVRTLLAITERDHPHPSMLFYTVGSDYLNRNDPARAVPLLERALALEPGQAETKLMLGRALRSSGRNAEAIPYLRAAVDAGVRPELAIPELVRALADTGRRGEAIAALRAIPDPARFATTSQVVLGSVALEVGDPELAERFLELAIGKEPDNAQVREPLGLALGMLGRYAEAASVLETACRLNPGDAKARLNLAVVYANMGRLDDARTQAGEALRLQPNYVRARQFLGALGGR